MFSGKNIKLLTCCLLSVAVTLGAVTWKVQEITGDAAGTLRFLRAMSIVKNNFDGKADNKVLFDGAIEGMVHALDDPYSVYLDKEDFTKLSEMTEGSFGGIGIVFGKRGDDYVVISALADHPGALAGIKSGDIILAVDGAETAKMNMTDVADKIRGKQGTEVVLRLRTKDGEEKEVKVVRKDIKAPSVGGQLLPNTKIGYIRITVFNEATGEDFKKTYEKLQAEGMEATILDLRGNPGGILDDGVAVAGMLVPKGPIVSLVYKNGDKYVENSSLEQIKYPLAVLVDHGTASAAEIVAGAVKDTKAGKLFGVKTFGKGSVQGVYRIDNDTAVKITTARYYTPSGVSIHNVGIEPDVKIELPDNAVTDVQLEAAQDYLQQELQKK